MKPKTGVLLVNLGTPDSPKTPDVRKYLREFLMDARVVDIPGLARWMLVNLIIAPFRAPKSARVYQQIWQDRGSPLMFYGEDLARLLQETLGDRFLVKLSMRYQSPSIRSALEVLQGSGVGKIIVIPLFPQYASATTGSVHEKVMNVVSRWQVIPEMVFISKFLDQPEFIQALVANGKKYMESEDFDHVLFSYHGVPERQIRKASQHDYCQLNDKCCSNINVRNQFCYRAQCYETTRILAAELGLTSEQYTVIFQSRLGNDPWIQPYADQTIRELPAQGIKRVLIFSPSFVADCLETTQEVGEEFKEIFEAAGGDLWQLVESLNDSSLWVASVKQMVLRRAGLPN